MDATSGRKKRRPRDNTGANDMQAPNAIVKREPQATAVELIAVARDP
jgi:hypothetical protein